MIETLILCAETPYVIYDKYNIKIINNSKLNFHKMLIFLIFICPGILL